MSSSEQPQAVAQVMISSTFTDLKEHRAAMINAINKFKLHPNVMEYDDARLDDVVESSLRMVRDSAAYIVLIGFKYGYIPQDARRNPKQLSITELEYNEAQRLDRPVLLFIMGDSHPVKKTDVERDPEKEKKLDAFRERAKKKLPSSPADRVYAVFNSLEEFRDKIGASLGELAKHLHATNNKKQKVLPKRKDSQSPIPTPPDFYAEPPYIGSHKFVGRESQLQELSDWAKSADPTNLLLFEAIGGNGKSMLAWQWTTNPRHAVAARSGEEAWAGRFWYSFYEHGAVMAEFCQRALAYMTGCPLRDLRKKKTAELKEPLLAQLHARPWLVVLDGLERVLVAYHRIDAAELPDDEATNPTDKIVKRNPRDAIRDEDNDLLRALAAASPSKVLVSSRLTPRVLLNASEQPINGVKRIILPGLRPPDAEKLLRSCGIVGDSAAIQSYLATNCDNHPLVIGALGGLIKNYLPARGNFDVWVTKKDGGARLDLGQLDLTSRRNHILRAAFAGLSLASRKLLSTLALLTESVGYDTLEALNPHIPAEPTYVEAPENQRAQAHYKRYRRARARWKAISSSAGTRAKLNDTVQDLESRGLLQFDNLTNRYDLHPVVRGAAVRFQRTDEREAAGKLVVDYFSSISTTEYEQAETLEELKPTLNAARTLLKLGHFAQAANTVRKLSNPLLFNLEAYTELLSLLRGLFTNGWQELPPELDPFDSVLLLNDVGIALRQCNEVTEAIAINGAVIKSRVQAEDWNNTAVVLCVVSEHLRELNRLAASARVATLALELAEQQEAEPYLFISRLKVFSALSLMGKWAEAEVVWDLIASMGRDLSRQLYRPGNAEYEFARFQFWKGSMTEQHLDSAERLGRLGKNHVAVRQIHILRGTWLLEKGEWDKAAATYHEAVYMSRARGIIDAQSETGLVLAKHHLRQLTDPLHEAKRLAQLRDPAHWCLAQLWHELGDTAQAKQHALLAYSQACADGEPYVNRHNLLRANELLLWMNVNPPTPPLYDSSKDSPFPWEADVRMAIERLRAGRS